MRVDINDPKIIAATEAFEPHVARGEVDRARLFYWNPGLSSDERLCCFVRISLASLLYNARLAGLTREEVIALILDFDQ